jgi:hypothetical protein
MYRAKLYRPEDAAWAAVEQLRADLAKLADDLQKPDPWTNGDDYGEGYVDGKNAAARRIRAVLAGEGPK